VQKSNDTNRPHSPAIHRLFCPTPGFPIYFPYLAHSRTSFGTPFVSFGVTNDDFENGVTYKNFVRVNLAARAEIQVPFFGSESLMFWQRRIL
jgi:hypothetical protein